MPKKALLAVLILLLPLLLPGAEGTFPLLPGRAGPVSRGMPVDQLLSTHGRELARLVDLNLEGMFSPALEILMAPGEKPALVAEIGCGEGGWVVERVTVRDPRFRLPKGGIGVGSALGELRRHYRVDEIAGGEGNRVAVVDELAMSFKLVSGGKGRVPDTAVISAVILF